MADEMTEAQKIDLIGRAAASGDDQAQQAVVRIARGWGHDEGLRIIDAAYQDLMAELNEALRTAPNMALDARAFLGPAEALWTARWRL